MPLPPNAALSSVGDTASTSIGTSFDHRVLPRHDQTRLIGSLICFVGGAFMTQPHNEGEVCKFRELRNRILDRDRLARVAEKVGADLQLCDLLDRIALDCPRKSRPWEGPAGQYDPQCKARFTDLEATSRPPPDLPPLMRKLTVIQGANDR